MRSMTGAEIFCAIRSYLASAARHGISPPGALTRAAAGTPLGPRHHMTQPATATAPLPRRAARLPVTLAACRRVQRAPS